MGRLYLPDIQATWTEHNLVRELDINEKSLSIALFLWNYGSIELNIVWLKKEIFFCGIC
jgi:hypothetical protein